MNGFSVKMRVDLGRCLSRKQGTETVGPTLARAVRFTKDNLICGSCGLGLVRGSPMAKKTGTKGSPRRKRDPERERGLEAIRREIRQGTYEDDDKLRLALDRMIDRLLERSKR